MMDIYIPKKEIVVSMRARSDLSAYISWRVRKIGTSRIVREANPYKNLITDSGLDRWGGTELDLISSLTTDCSVGTGSTAPATSDTDLQAQIANTDNRSKESGGVQTSTLPYFGWIRYVYQFGAGVAEGNLNELGFRPSGGDLFSRQLFLDSGGSPTTVTVLADEFLEVTYEIRKQMPNPIDFVQDPVDISGTNYEVTTRPTGAVDGETAWGTNGLSAFIPAIGVSDGLVASTDPIGPIADGFGGFSNNSSSTRGNYMPGSFTRTLEGVWDPGNQTGMIQKVFWGRVGGSGGEPQWQTGFNPPINKTSDDRLILQFFADWGRA